MCKMRVAVLKENLGQRETGYTLWDGRQVMEQTAKQIKDLIKSGKKVCGLTLDEKGELILDKDGFFTTNLMVHRHCGNYKPLMEEGCMANLFYIVIGSRKDGENTFYDCISTRFEQLTLNEADVRAYLRIGMISAGCRIGEDGKIEIASLEFKEAVPTKPVVEQKPVEPEKEGMIKEPEKKEEVVKPEGKEPEQPEVKEPEKKPEPAKPEVKEPDKKPEPAKPEVKEPDKKPEPAKPEVKKAEQPKAEAKSKAVEPKKEVSKKVEKRTK